MIRQLIKSRRKYVLIEIDTQKDFFFTDGTACVKNHKRILSNIRRLIAWARYRKVPVISICEIRSGHNGEAVNYCIEGTDGQKKIHYTLLPNRATFTADSNPDLPRDILRQYSQVILHKRCVDPFDEPRIERLLSEVDAGEFVLIGAGAESAIKATALGLLQRGKRVRIVIDAAGMHNKRDATLALRKIRAKGAKLTETKNLAGTSHLKSPSACECMNCRSEKMPLKLVRNIKILQYLQSKRGRETRNSTY